MSRFFRSADSSSSSDTDSESDVDEITGKYAEDIATPSLELEELAGASTRESQLPTPASYQAASEDDVAISAENVSSYRRISLDHRDVLLHALLEERCLNEAVASHGDVHHSRESPEVQAEARAKYQRISTQLASLNLISTGLADDGHAKTRRRYRTGLDILSQSTTTTVPVRLRRLLTDSEAEIDTYRLSENERFPSHNQSFPSQPPVLPYPLRRLITGAETVQEQQRFDQIHYTGHVPRNNYNSFSDPLSDARIAIAGRGFLRPRYAQDFEELNVLGKGGYGVVFRVRHKLDSQSYAIKKVPLSSDRLKRIQEHGQREVDEVLGELRALARLDHPNIVRYHTSWIEWTTNPSASRSKPSLSSDIFSGVSEDAVLGAQDQSAADHLARVATTSGSEQVDVLFETSGHDQSRKLVELSKSADAKHLFADSVANYKAEASNGILDSIDEVDGHLSGARSQSDENLDQPTLVLHMQMSLHPMTLAEYLAPKPTFADEHAPPPLSHCFHLEPSVAILQSILNGVEYLHDRGMVHRDIKPANIFIGAKTGSEALQELTCSQCRTQRKATPIPLDVRIGDFGLVTLSDPTQADPSNTKAVGTELYRSVTLGASSTQIDIHALGIVAFELLWKFETRMERIHVIRKLKEGEFPPGFANRFGRHAEGIAKCIGSMILPSSAGLSVRDVKQVLVDLQRTL